MYKQIITLHKPAQNTSLVTGPKNDELNEARDSAKGYLGRTFTNTDKKNPVATQSWETIEDSIAFHTTHAQLVIDASMEREQAFSSRGISLTIEYSNE
jgi:hypothetical protein